MLESLFPLDISKIKMKTKHALGVKENSSGSGLAVVVCRARAKPRCWRSLSMAVHEHHLP